MLVRWRWRRSGWGLRGRRVRKTRDVQSVLIVLLGVAAFAFFLIWVFVALDPFQSTNPFLKEVTIGQSVIGDWRYGGTVDGKMRFYDAYYQNSVIPDTQTTFAADGEFVHIDGFTASPLTFEPAYESETFGTSTWLWIGSILLAVILTVTRHKRRVRSPAFRALGRPTRGVGMRGRSR